MCGFVGICGNDNAAKKMYRGLLGVQHRGQDSAGIGTLHNNHFYYKKELGKVEDIFQTYDFKTLPGEIGVGHVRYPTIGAGKRNDSQPFFSRQPGILMVHNGNITNYSELKNYLLSKSFYLSSTNDIEPVLYIFSHELNKIKSNNHTLDDVVLAIRNTYKIVKGAFSIATSLFIEGKETLMLCRDPYGIRPAVWSEKNGSFAIASESVCLDAMDFAEINEIESGFVAFFQKGKKPIFKQIDSKKNAPCIFEYIYFARPDSIMNNKTIYDIRLNLGRQVAKEWLKKKIDVDLVIPVPDTSRPAAISFAETIRKPLREGFIKNRYIGRTFILSNQNLRENALTLKLNPIASEIKGKKVVLMDDSVVRGNTLKRTVNIMKKKKPKEIHIVIHSPPVMYPCYYGIDMSTENELIANRFATLLNTNKLSLSQIDHTHLEELLRNELDVNSFTYLSIEGLNQVYPESKCAACFDGQYPFVVDNKFVDEISHDRKKKEFSLEDFSNLRKLG